MKTVWPDASWNAPMLENDGCSMSLDSSTPSAWVSAYSKSGKSFSCGASAAGLLACQKEGDGGTVLCLQSLEERKAVRFPSNVSTITPREPGSVASPLQVKLANGDTCNAQSHDQAHHYDNRSSWLWCQRGVLLLPKSFDPAQSAGEKYFDKTAARWTAQYSVNDAKPTPVGVTQVIYAP